MSSTIDLNRVTNELITLRDYIRWGASRFRAADLYFGHGTDNAYDEAELLVLHVVHITPPIDDEWLDARLVMEERECIVALFERRIQERLPAAYLTGQSWFAGLPFRVNPNVLVPRSPIAELIEKRFEPWLIAEPEYILDLCTGSGCIGIACAYAFPDAAVDLSDISPEALVVAGENIDFHGMSDRVRAIQSDLFSDLSSLRYDLIVSNPPYVDAEDLASMPAEYSAEPALGLASGADGLDFTRRLLREAEQHLTDSGVLVVEVGNSWVALEATYPDVPFTWLEFARGGHGVFLLTAGELRRAAEQGLL